MRVYLRIRSGVRSRTVMVQTRTPYSKETLAEILSLLQPALPARPRGPQRCPAFGCILALDHAGDHCSALPRRCPVMLGVPNQHYMGRCTRLEGHAGDHVPKVDTPHDPQRCHRLVSLDEHGYRLEQCALPPGHLPPCRHTVE